MVVCVLTCSSKGSSAHQQTYERIYEELGDQEDEPKANRSGVVDDGLGEEGVGDDRRNPEAIYGVCNPRTKKDSKNPIR